MSMMQVQSAGQPNKAASLADQMDAVRSMSKGGGSGANKFAATLMLLSEVTTQLAELDEAAHQATLAGENENAEARKWREISASTMKFAKMSLLEQQIRAIEVLQELSAQGCSIIKGVEKELATPHPTATGKAITDKIYPTKSNSERFALTPPHGMLAPPPGLSAPPGLEAPHVPVQQAVPSNTFSSPSVCSTIALNLDAYEDDSDSDW